MNKTFITAILFFVSLQIVAQEKWTLRQCIDYAIENNIEIKQQEIQVKNSEINLSNSKNSRLPDLSGSVSQNFSFGQIVNYSTNTNITNNANGARLSVSTSIPIFTGFKIENQIKADKLDLKAATEGLKKAKENLELQVTSYFLDVLFKKEIRKVYEEQADLSRKQVDRTKMLVESGKVPLSQLYDINAQLAKDELNVTTSNNDLSLSLLNLAQALNLQEVDGFDVNEPNTDHVIENNIASILPPQDIYRSAIQIKPHVKEAEFKVESSRKALKVAQADYLPTLSFGAGYGTSVQRRYGSRNESFIGQFRDNGSEYLGFTINIPLFNRFQTRNKVRMARLSIENQILALDNVKLALYKEIQQAYQNAVSAQSKYGSTEKAFIAADEAFKYAEERYAIGKSTVFEFNEAQTKLLTSKSEQIQAKYDFLFRAKILDFYRGIQINIE